MRKLWKWIKRLFATPPHQYTIRILDKGRIVECVATGTIGMRLCVSTGSGGRLVSERDCADPLEFWSVWEALNPQPLVWEDGSPFRPPFSQN